MNDSDKTSPLVEGYERLLAEKDARIRDLLARLEAAQERERGLLEALAARSAPLPFLPAAPDDDGGEDSSEGDVPAPRRSPALRTRYRRPIPAPRRRLPGPDVVEDITAPAPQSPPAPLAESPAPRPSLWTRFWQSLRDDT